MIQHSWSGVQGSIIRPLHFHSPMQCYCYYLSLLTIVRYFLCSVQNTLALASCQPRRGGGTPKRRKRAPAEDKSEGRNRNGTQRFGPPAPALRSQRNDAPATEAGAASERRRSRAEGARDPVILRRRRAAAKMQIKHFYCTYAMLLLTMELCSLLPLFRILVPPSSPVRCPPAAGWGATPK